jgi:hypothetical protein
MADKLTQEQMQASLVCHLTAYSEKVAEVVDDFHAVVKDGDMPQDGKEAFAYACMMDVSQLTDILTGMVKATLKSAGIEVPEPPQVAHEADIIELDAYRNSGGLLN